MNATLVSVPHRCLLLYVFLYAATRLVWITTAEHLHPQAQLGAHKWQFHLLKYIHTRAYEIKSFKSHLELVSH